MSVSVSCQTRQPVSPRGQPLPPRADVTAGDWLGSLSLIAAGWHWWLHLSCH